MNWLQWILSGGAGWEDASDFLSTVDSFGSLEEDLLPQPMPLFPLALDDRPHQVAPSESSRAYVLQCCAAEARPGTRLILSFGPFRCPNVWVRQSCYTMEVGLSEPIVMRPFVVTGSR